VILSELADLLATVGTIHAVEHLAGGATPANSDLASQRLTRRSQ
jgi:hypothetical protein